MRRDQGIQRRLIYVLGIGALAIAIASTLAVLALRDLGRSFEEVSRHELPGMVAGLDLARHAAAIEGRGPSLIAAENGWERYRQAALLEQDFQSLDDELKIFKRDPPQRAAEDVAEIDRQALLIRRTLDEMKRILTTLAEFQTAQRVAGDKLSRAQDSLRQSFVPTLVALTETIDTRAVADSGQILFVNSIRDPLLQCERLLDAAYNTLLQVPDQRTVAEIIVTRGRVERLFGQLDARTDTLPAGIRDGFEAALKDLRQAAGGPDGLIGNRLGEIEARSRLASLIEINRASGARLNFRTRRVLSMVEQDVDQANARISAAVTSRTAVLTLIALAAILLASTFSYFFVVRDLGHNLHAVTEAMMRLAAGERGVAVPATRRDDELGALARAFSVFRDNAVALERIDSELRQTSEHLLFTFTHMNDGFSVFDTEARLVTSNAKFRELYDLPAALARPGTPLAAILDALAAGTVVHDQNGREVAMAALHDEPASRPRQYELHVATGRIIELRSNPTPRGFVTVHTDRTQRRAIEAQLLQARKMEMVGQLTGGIAHDFNNILAAITGNLHLQRDALVAAGLTTERLDRAMAAVDRATLQIDRMLSYARRQTLKPEPTDVAGLIEGMLDLVTVSVGDAVEVVAQLAPDTPAVMIDVAQMENALLNLAINARDAMPAGGRLVFATRRRIVSEDDGVLAAGDCVEVEVSDTGHGMAPEVVARATEPFFTTKARGRGGGLGLSMVYGFVKQSGGDLRIDSRPGEGTRVSLFLPAARVGAKAEPSLLPSPARAGPERDGVILVVEDAPDLLEVTVASLRSSGYAIVAADGVAQALDTLAKDADIDLILTDIELKDRVDGTALAAEATARRPELAVVFTSAHSIESLEKTTSRPDLLAVWPFVGKPASRDDLDDAMRRARAGVHSFSTSTSKM